MTTLALPILLGMVGLVAAATPPTGSAQAPPSPAPTPAVIIDYHFVDFVRVAGVVYYARGSEPGRPLNERDLGPAAGEVEYRAEGRDAAEPCGFNWLPDGTASELEIGTELFEVMGYDPAFRLAARRDGEI